MASSPPIRSIALLVTQNCNLACTYCYGNKGTYGSSGHMNSETARKAIDWLIEQSGELRNPGVVFFGGEPLLNFALMKEVVAYARKRGGESGKAFEFSVATNASLLSDEIITFLKENEITPVVSFDGCKEAQDSQRPFKGGRGSYDVVAPKIRKLLETFPGATARATLTGQRSPREVTVALNEIGFRSTQLTVASPSLFDAEDERKEEENGSRNIAHEMDSESQELLANIRSRNTDTLRRQKDNCELVSQLTALLNKERKYFGCGAGRAYVGVSNSGEVFLCHRFVGIREYRLGTVFDDTLERDKYLKSPIKNVEECRSCFARYNCGGGCYHENVGASGAVNKPSRSWCRVMRRSVELATYISGQLTDDDKDYLLRQGIIRPQSCPFDFPE